MSKTFARPFLALGLLALASLLTTTVQPAAAATWGANYFPNVALTTQDGKTVHFYDDLLKGKRFILNLIYTECGDSCPLETARLTQVKKILGEHLGRDIWFYSLSIDPEHDTPAVLKAYAAKFHTGPGWLFLTGNKQDIELIRRKLGLHARADENGLTDHTTSVMIGNEPTGEWIKDSSLDNPHYMASIVRDWLNAGKGFENQNATYAIPEHAADKGGYLFQGRCAACHTIGGGDGIGPDLQGVTKRRDRAWLARFMAAPNELLAQKDPTAVALYAQYKEVKMPNLRLSPVDVQALLGYLDAPTPAAEPAPAAATSPAKHYTLHGKVLALHAKDHTATIQGEAIPGWMGAMTMPYPVPHEQDWQALRVQQVMTATVEVHEEGDYALVEVQAGRSPEATADHPAPARTARR
jgi:protein SCO1/2